MKFMTINPFKTILASLLCLLILLFPALSGYAAMNVYKEKTSKILIGEVTQTSCEKIVKDALNDEGVAALKEQLVSSDYHADKSQATKWDYSGREGYFCTVNYVSSTPEQPKVQISFLTEGDKVVKCGALVFTEEKTVNVYDCAQNKVYFTSTVESKDSSVKVTWENGPFVPKGKAGLTEQIAQAPDFSTKSFPPSGTCGWCTFICNGVLAMGCGWTGLAQCGIICAGPWIETCGPICGVIWGLMCWIGGEAADCATNCISWGYCN